MLKVVKVMNDPTALRFSHKDRLPQHKHFIRLEVSSTQLQYRLILITHTVLCH